MAAGDLRDHYVGAMLEKCGERLVEIEHVENRTLLLLRSIARAMIFVPAVTAVSSVMLLAVMAACARRTAQAGLRGVLRD